VRGCLPWLLVLFVGCGDEAFEPRRETRGLYTVAWVAGDAYEMGYQQAELLRPELLEGLEEIERNLLLKGMLAIARDLELTKVAVDNSYPEIIEECRGLMDGLGDAGWTMDHCMLLNFGDVIVEFLRRGIPEAEDLTPGCTQFAAAGEATTGGRLLHGRVLDWSSVDFIVKHPVVFVRRPEGGIPHAVIGFPGNLSPYQGMNAEGVAVASNEVHPRDNKVNDRRGRSHVQLVGRLLASARSLADARSVVLETNHMSLELVLISDGTARSAEVFEMSPTYVDILPLEEGVVYATNHFQGPRTGALDQDPVPPGSELRLQRLAELLPPDGKETLHRRITPGTMVRVMRDRKDPTTGALSPAGEIDDAKSIASNGALYAVVFAPETRTFWVAAGQQPVPAQPFTGFSLDRLLGRSGGEPAPDPLR
jgi:hypothetical protein